MNCPKCPQTALAKLRETSPLPAWSCPRCGGTWIADGKALGAVPPVGLPVGEAQNNELDRKAGVCPQGHGLLTRAQTHLDGGFFLERCTTCWGVWFDQGEWHRIAAAGLASGLFEIWSTFWQKERRREQARDHLRVHLIDELGEDFVSRIESIAADLKEHPSRSLGVAYLLACLRGDRP
jgi:Zn-finger nucleic acid-binding protein